EQTVKKEQGIIGQEIRMYDDSPGWRVMFNMLMAMYHNHPVRIDIAGTVESIAQIDHNLLYKCYNTFYNPANMFICIAGNVDTEQVLKQIKEGINPVEPVEITRIGSDEPEGIVKPLVEQSLEVAQPMFCFGYKETVSKPECTVKEKICTALLLEIIAGDASPLYKELTDEGLINDEFSTEHFCGHGYSAFIFEGESKNPKLVAEKIRNEIERLKTEGIDKKLFSAIRCGMYGNAIRLFDSVEGIAMQMVDCAMLDSGLFDDVKYLKSVTADDVYKRLLKFEQDKAVLSVINPVEEV
ncbi:MAG: pitrilysin family protein, partial [Acutalibacteraceae bacterium]|nr:pitrilysin family protein [Acutalibacteraceae bacterium]